MASKQYCILLGTEQRYRANIDSMSSLMIDLAKLIQFQASYITRNTVISFISKSGRQNSYFFRPSRLMLFGRSMGRPSARSQTSCTRGPRARDTPKVTV